VLLSSIKHGENRLAQFLHSLVINQVERINIINVYRTYFNFLTISKEVASQSDNNQPACALFQKPAQYISLRRATSFHYLQEGKKLFLEGQIGKYITATHLRVHRSSSSATDADHQIGFTHDMTTYDIESNTRWFHDASKSPESHCRRLFVTVPEESGDNFISKPG